MSNALAGAHYCAHHQGNHSHYSPHNCAMCAALAQLKRIADALGTGETGEALIEVARNACAAEMELSALKRSQDV